MMLVNVQTHADIIDWTGGAGNGQWSTSTNWNPTTPTADDAAVINVSGAAVEITGHEMIQYFEVGQDSQLTINTGGALNAYTDNYAYDYSTLSGTLTNHGEFEYWAPLYVDGALLNHGDVNALDILHNTGLVENHGTMYAASPFINDGDFINSGSFSAGHDFGGYSASGSIYNSGSFQVDRHAYASLVDNSGDLSAINSLEAQVLNNSGHLDGGLIDAQFVENSGYIGASYLGSFGGGTQDATNHGEIYLGRAIFDSFVNHGTFYAMRLNSQK
jgi:hypothetical protein